MVKNVNYYNCTTCDKSIPEDKVIIDYPEGNAFCSPDCFKKYWGDDANSVLHRGGF